MHMQLKNYNSAHAAGGTHVVIENVCYPSVRRLQGYVTLCVLMICGSSHTINSMTCF